MSAKRKNVQEHADVKPELQKDEEVKDEHSERPPKKEKHQVEDDESVMLKVECGTVQEEESHGSNVVEKSTEADVPASNDVPGSRNVDSDGAVFWQLDGKRRVKVNKWKGTTYIDIREYYEKGGQQLPGKKGISLSASTLKVLQSKMKEIEEVVGSL